MLVVMSGITVAVVTYIAVARTAATYDSTALLVVPSPNGDIASVSVTALPRPGLLPSDYVTVAISDAVLRRTLRLEGESQPTPQQVTSLRNRISVTNGAASSANSNATQTDVLSLTASAGNSRGAAQTANDLARSLIAWDTARVATQVRHMQLVAGHASASGARPFTRSRASEEAAVLALTPVQSPLSFVQSAVPPQSAAGPHPLRDAILALVATLLVAVTAVLAIRAPRRPRDSGRSRPGEVGSAGP
jgi:capsular polysaccharide biosynthesis protein